VRPCKSIEGFKTLYDDVDVVTIRYVKCLQALKVNCCGANPDDFCSDQVPVSYVLKPPGFDLDLIKYRYFGNFTGDFFLVNIMISGFQPY
jgi:hypothetical protein